MQGLLPESVYRNKLPEMHLVKQSFPDEQLAAETIPKIVWDAVHEEHIASKIRHGMQIALLVGSRGIDNLPIIVKSLGDALKSLGAVPFIVPAMGSHGGATAEGQSGILHDYGICMDTMQMEIRSSMEVAEIGRTAHGILVCADKNALDADMIVPVGRVKPHTDFSGSIESGLCKMLSIGIGKHEGCLRLHQHGFENFDWLIPEVGEYVIRHSRVGFGLAIIENAYDKTCMLEAVPTERILEREPELLSIARTRMPAILLKAIDVLVVDWLGKDISGAGMDPNIIGRMARGPVPGFQGPTIQRIVVKGLTPTSHGNACGIGLADFALQDCLAKVDVRATAINAISSGNPGAAKLPIAVETVEEGIRASLKTAVAVNNDAPKIVNIESTLSLGEIWISDGLLAEARENPRLTICE